MASGLPLRATDRRICNLFGDQATEPVEEASACCCGITKRLPPLLDEHPAQGRSLRLRRQIDRQRSAGTQALLIGLFTDVRQSFDPEKVNSVIKGR
jgi:hypothetical protein